MDLISVDLCEVPVSITDYKAVELDELPKVVLGFQIKNQFDQKRYTIKGVFNPQRFTHFCYTSSLEPIFLYGIELTLQERFNSFLNDINQFGSVFLTCKTVEEYIGKYKALLSKYGLSCDECFRRLYDGLYPIDMSCLNELVPFDTSLPIQNLPSLLEISKKQWYLTVPNFGIYVLGTSGAYVTDI